MPSGDKGDYWTRDDRRMPANHWEPYAYEGGTDRLRDSISKENYYKEWKDIMDFGYLHPCIVVWVPFNEAWGQFDTEKVAAWTKAQDPSRLVDPASGGNFHHCGDMCSSDCAFIVGIMHNKAKIVKNRFFIVLLLLMLFMQKFLRSCLQDQQ